MCEPTTLAMMAMASSAAGTVASTLGAVQQGKSAQNLSNYNAQLAQNDAIAQRDKAAFDAKAQERKAKLFAGTQRASTSGGELLDMQDVFDMTATEIKLEELAILHGGEMGYRAGQQGADLARFQGEVAKQTAQGKAAGSLLTGASSVAGMGAKYFPSTAKPTTINLPTNNYHGVDPYL